MSKKFIIAWIVIFVAWLLGDFVIHAVGLNLADIVGDARPSQYRPGAAEVDRVLGREHGYVLRAAEKDSIRRDERIVPGGRGRSR